MSDDVLDPKLYDGLGFGRGHGPPGRSGAEEVAATQTKVHTYTEWFNTPVLKDTTIAPTPGTPDAEAMAHHGQINIPFNSYIGAIHLHQIKDGTSGSNVLEIYRWRDSVHTLIASVTLASGGGDFSANNFTMVSTALRQLQAWDYLFLQATSVMGAAHRPAAFVDVHFVPAP
jgi:hypothetical protein